ncbi:hypothetical protein GCK72_000852 [Caenorhabditis remanei]|uniref:Uncharacterized protein n=1 Tax=Caenorhabditis remanei TaxID=31234 RepID=E3N4Q2_CAERE|nr:hypothetical protein GCK72_000852 [Caenorhabditis remanei]EFO86436.1 hypothetical protein CRE_01230 [Caenorhabditis remanei]KAF1769039.1 hypothetical protein GCK72_000852 [Caenorhabditis remanei]
MADDAYEFLSPDLLAPPPPITGPAPGGPANPETPPAPVNELAPVSAAEKFEVPRTAATKDSKSKSKSKDSEGKAKGKGKKTRTKRSGRGSKSRESSEPLPSLSAFKWQMIFSAVLVFASVALTLMVLIDGLM